MAAVITVILIIVFAAIWTSIPDKKTKGNPNFHSDSFDKESWKNWDIHHDSGNHVIPGDFLDGKYFNAEDKKIKIGGYIKCLKEDFSENCLILTATGR